MKILTKTEAEGYENHWVNYNTTNGVYPWSLFKSGSKFIFGYEMSHDNFSTHLGAGKHYQIRFGVIPNNDSGTQNDLFTLIVWGVDGDKKPNTDYIMFEESDALTTELIGDDVASFADTIIAGSTAKAWLTSWAAEDKTNVGGVPSNIFVATEDMAPGSTAKLKGYYEENNFTELLAVATKTAKIQIYFGSPTASTTRDAFNLVLSASDFKANTEASAMFFDTAAPCPPLCGNG